MDLSEVTPDRWKKLADNKAFPMLSNLLDVEDDNATVLKAIVEILNRAYGKVVDRTELTGKDGSPLIVRWEK